MKRGLGGVLFNDAILSQINIRNMIDSEGCEGLGKLYYVLYYLRKCYHSIGMLNESSVHTIARMAHKHDETMKNFILKWGIFRILGDNRFFVFQGYRRMFGFSPDITEREYDVIGIYGNNIKKEPEEYTLRHPVEDDDAKADSDSPGKIKAVKNDCKSEIKAEHSENVTSQSFDDEDVTASVHIGSCNCSGKCIIRKGNNLNLPTSSTVSDVDSEAAGGEEDSFNFLEKKLISCTEWRKSTSRTRGIDLEDDKILHFFAEWMRDYCISNNSMPRDLNEIMHYASSLLTQGLRTRKCFDEAYRRDFLHEVPTSGRKKQREERPVYAVRPMVRASCEELINGRRVGMEGQILPSHAPRQYNDNERWSYRLDKYVDVSEWDREAEEAARLEFERKKEEAKKAECQAIYDRWSKENDSRHNGMQSVGDVIKGSILPKIKPR